MTISLLNTQKIMAFQKIHADFKDIMKHEKCRTCSCFYGDVLNNVYEKIKKFREIESHPEVIKVEQDFRLWIQEADLLKTHG